MADLTALALNAADTLSVAELHGVVCGLAVWPQERFQLQALVDLVGVESLTDEINVEAFVNASVEALMADDMSFTPLLPDDDAELRSRLESVAEWCAGFLAGFGAAAAVRGLSSFETLPGEVQEIVDDLSAITDMDVEHVGLTVHVAGPESTQHRPEDDQAESPFDADSAETDLMQIQEFVKVGVLLILGTIAGHADDLPQ